MSATRRDYDGPEPVVLADGMAAALREFGGEPGPAGDWPPEPHVTAGEALLERLLRDGCGTRAAAPDLLVADALVTRAFELASAEPARLEQRAHDAMVRLAALAAGRA
ncbi:MAG TPA: hypothetical protein VFY16_09795 [Gemmatimonadaceae bacterium]|nr:hypothetical protein [Gemmatimonadaceae bacterium]